MTFYVVSEFSLWPLLLDVLRRRPVTILGVWARLRVLAPVLNWVVGRLKRLPTVDDITDIDGLPWHERVPGKGGFYNDVHHRAEARLRQSHDLAADDPLAADYAYAMRKATTTAVGLLVPVYLTVEWLSENRAPGSWRLVGAPPLLRELADILAPPFPPFVTDDGGLAFSNALNLIGLGLLGSAWLAWRVRPAVGTESLDLMADEADDFDRALIHRAAAAGKSFVVLDRSLDHRRFQGAKLTPYRHILREDVRIAPALAVRLVAALWRELFWIWRRHPRQDSGLCTQWAAQVFRRQVFAALFARYRPKMFWGRDDYSSEHVIRNHELRKVGGRCFGMAHGLPINTYVHMWREIDFDVYFSFGTHLTRHYRDAWAPGMTIVPTGPFRQPYDMRARIATTTRTKDIVFFAMAAAEMARIAAVVRDVAAHFQDRKVLVKMKNGRSREDQEAFAASFGNGPANLVITTDDTYQLMRETSYALTSGSSTTVESLSFGLATFVVDVDPSLLTMYYRQFPGLCVTEAKTVIDRIEAIEAGRERFDFDGFAELVVLDGPHPLDVIARALELDAPPAQGESHAA